MPKKASHDIAPIIRAAFVRAAKRLEAKGKSLPDIIEKELEENPLETLKAMSRFNIRETKVSGNIGHDHKHTHTLGLSTTSSFIRAVIGGGEESASAEPMPLRPLLPATVCDEESGHGQSMVLRPMPGDTEES